MAKAKAKAKVTNVAVTKTAEPTKEVKMSEKERKASIAALLVKLNASDVRHEKSRLRGKLRRLGHWGGTRRRTYTDKSTGKCIVIDKEAKTAKKKSA